MKKVILFVLFFAMSSTEILASGQFNTGYGKIVHLRTYGDTSTLQQTYIQVDANNTQQNAKSCMRQDLGHGDLNMYIINSDEKNLVSMVLAAYMSGKSVQVTSNDSAEIKHNGEVCRLIYIDMKD